VSKHTADEGAWVADARPLPVRALARRCDRRFGRPPALFLPQLDDLVREGTVMLDHIAIVRYTDEKARN